MSRAAARLEHMRETQTITQFRDSATNFRYYTKFRRYCRFRCFAATLIQATACDCLSSLARQMYSLRFVAIEMVREHIRLKCKGRNHVAYSEDSEWRNRDRFLSGRDQIREFLASKWERELDYRLTKSLWSFTDNRMAVRFQYEYHDADDQWFRAYGNELWEFDDDGLMRRREASINEIRIDQSERKFHWPAPGPRPTDDDGIPTVK